MKANNYFGITIYKFFGIRYVDFDFSGVCVIVGPNGSGKTTILDSITELSHCIKTKSACRQSIHNMTETTPTEITVFSNYHKSRITIGSEMLYRFVKRKDHGHRQLDAIIRKYNNYHDYMYTELINFGSCLTKEKALLSNGRNAFIILNSWKYSSNNIKRERYNFIVDILKEAFPNFFNSLYFQSKGNRMFLRVLHSASGLVIDHLPHSFLTMIIHLMAVCSTPDNGIMSIDDPEISLHPAAIKVLIAALREQAQERNLTILLATHSPYILNEFKNQYDKVFVICRRQDNQIARLDTLKDTEWLQHFKLGNLYG